jgi:hypothetical protein
VQKQHFLESRDWLLKCHCVSLDSADFQMSPFDIFLNIR